MENAGNCAVSVSLSFCWVRKLAHNLLNPELIGEYAKPDMKIEKRNFPPFFECSADLIDIFAKLVGKFCCGGSNKPTEQILEEATV